MGKSHLDFAGYTCHELGKLSAFASDSFALWIRDLFEVMIHDDIAAVCCRFAIVFQVMPMSVEQISLIFYTEQICSVSQKTKHIGSTHVPLEHNTFVRSVNTIKIVATTVVGMGNLSTRKGRDNEGGGADGDDAPYGGTWLVSNGESEQQPDSIPAKDTLFLKELRAKVQVSVAVCTSSSARSLQRYSYCYCDTLKFIYTRLC